MSHLKKPTPAEKNIQTQKTNQYFHKITKKISQPNQNSLYPGNNSFNNTFNSQPNNHLPTDVKTETVTESNLDNKINQRNIINQNLSNQPVQNNQNQTGFNNMNPIKNEPPSVDNNDFNNPVENELKRPVESKSPPAKKPKQEPVETTAIVKAEPVDHKPGQGIKQEIKIWSAQEMKEIFHPVWLKIYNHPDAPPFQVPVDPIGLQIPDYLEVVKTPMDMTTIRMKLMENGDYTEPWEFITDMWLMFENAWLYNRRNSKGGLLSFLYNSKIQSVYENTMFTQKIIGGIFF